jgi:hypothetical protein
MFAIALWDAPRARCCSPATASGSSRSTTAVGRGLSLRLGAEGVLEQPGFSRAIDPRRSPPTAPSTLIPAPLTIFAEGRKLNPGTTGRLARGGADPDSGTAARARSPPKRVRRRPAGDLADELREDPARLGPCSPRPDVPVRCAPLRRSRTRPARRASQPVCRSIR